MSLDVITTDKNGLFNYTECSSLTEAQDCKLPEKEFSESDFIFLSQNYGILE